MMMTTPRQDILAVLLKSIYEQNLISENAYRQCLNHLHSRPDFPLSSQYYVPIKKDSSVKREEEKFYGCAQNTK